MKDLSSKFDGMDWNRELKPLFRKYAGRKHPLQYENLYQLLVMVILSARDYDRNINLRAPALFRKFSSIRRLAKANPEDLFPFAIGTGLTTGVFERGRTTGLLNFRFGIDLFLHQRMLKPVSELTRVPVVLVTPHLSYSPKSFSY